MLNLIMLLCLRYRELRAKYRVLARLVDHEEHEKFISSLKSKLLGKGRLVAHWER